MTYPRYVLGFYCVILSLNAQNMKKLLVIKGVGWKRGMVIPLFLFNNASITEEEQPAAQLEYYTWLNIDMVDSWTVLKE